MKTYVLVDEQHCLQDAAPLRMTEEQALLANRDIYLNGKLCGWIEAYWVDDKGRVKPNPTPATTTTPAKPPAKYEPNPDLIDALERLGYKRNVAKRKAATVDPDLELDIALQTIFASGT